MTDTTEPQVEPVAEKATPLSLLQRLKRLCTMLFLLFCIWAFFAYGLPRIMGTATRTPASAVATQPEKTPPPAAVPLSSAEEKNAFIVSLQQRIDQLEARIAALESAPGFTAPAADSADMAAADARLAELEQSLKAQQLQVDELKNATETSAQALATITAFGQMKDAVLAGQSYREPLGRLATLAEGNAAAAAPLETLSAQADDGLPDLAALQKRFGGLIGRALAPKASAWEDAMHALVRVRKVGDTEGTDDEAVIARAEARLQQGNVVQAVKELSQLSPPAADVLQPWKKQAEQYIAAMQALGALEVLLMHTSS